jgi:hypothetical protein
LFDLHGCMHDQVDSVQGTAVRFAHMPILFRYLLVLIIAVLPLQGSAWAMPHGDGAAPAHGMAVADQLAGDDAVAMPDDAVAMPDGHCDHAGKAPLKAKSTHAKCHAGASCCIGAVAPPNAQARLSSRFLSTDAHAVREPAMTLFVPPALERPPRLS